MADRIGVMQAGRLAQVGTPAEVYERPASRFVAEFLGAANVLAGTRQADGRFVLAGLGVAVRTEGRGAPGPGLLALRPERLRIGGEGPNRLEGVLVEQAYAGETLTHAVRLADGTLIRASQALADGFGAARLAVGSAVTLAWQPEAGIELPPA